MVSFVGVSLPLVIGMVASRTERITRLAQFGETCLIRPFGQLNHWNFFPRRHHNHVSV